jgi:hypothetical protein
MTVIAALSDQGLDDGGPGHSGWVGRGLATGTKALGAQELPEFLIGQRPAPVYLWIELQTRLHALSATESPHLCRVLCHAPQRRFS